MNAHASKFIRQFDQMNPGDSLRMTPMDINFAVRNDIFSHLIGWHDGHYQVRQDRDSYHYIFSRCAQPYWVEELKALSIAKARIAHHRST